jgi:hypothetical protein
MRYDISKLLTCEIDAKQIFYVRNPYDHLICTESGLLKSLLFLQSYKLVIVDCSNEHWGEYPGTMGVIQQEFRKIGINFIILSHCPEDHDPEQGILFFPYWYYFSINRFKVLPVTTNKRFVLGCLNSNPRPHRIVNYYMLKNKKYWNDCCTSFFSTDPLPWRGDDVDLQSNEIEFWDSIKSELPDRRNIINFADLGTNDLLPVTQSYINLVTETTVANRVFVTEKTWKPVSAGQIFLIFGSPGTMSHLKSQGVDIFSDLIDHDYYDQETDWRTRLVKLHKVLDDLIDQDLEALYKNTQQRRQLNQEKFFLGQFDLKYRPAVLHQIEKLL